MLPWNFQAWGEFLSPNVHWIGLVSRVGMWPYLAWRVQPGTWSWTWFAKSGSTCWLWSPLLGWSQYTKSRTTCHIWSYVVWLQSCVLGLTLYVASGAICQAWDCGDPGTACWLWSHAPGLTPCTAACLCWVRDQLALEPCAGPDPYSAPGFRLGPWPLAAVHGFRSSTWLQSNCTAPDPVCSPRLGALGLTQHIALRPAYGVRFGMQPWTWHAGWVREPNWCAGLAAGLGP